MDLPASDPPGDALDLDQVKSKGATGVPSPTSDPPSDALPDPAESPGDLLLLLLYSRYRS